MHDRLIYWYPGERSVPYRATINTAWFETLCTTRVTAEVLIQKLRHVGFASSVFRVTFLLESQKKSYCQRRNTFLYVYLTTLNTDMRWAWNVTRMGEERGVYRVLVGKPEGRRPLGRPRRRCVDNIRIGLQEVGCGYMVWIGLAQDTDRWRTRLSAVMNLRVPWNAENFLTSCKPVSFSRRTLHHGVNE